MQKITSGLIEINPNWGILNLSPFQYLIDASESDAIIQLPEIKDLPSSGVELSFRITDDSDNLIAITTSGEDDTFTNATSNTALAIPSGFIGTILLNVSWNSSTPQWNVTQIQDGASAPIRISGTITQSSTDKPVITVGSFLGDKTKITLTPLYVGVGNYKIDFPTGTFTDRVVTAMITPSGNYSYGFAPSGSNSIILTTQTLGGTPTNGLLTKAGFIIEINPK